jgi:hypothetical protein
MASGHRIQANDSIKETRNCSPQSPLWLSDLSTRLRAFPDGFLGIDEIKATCVGFL